MRVGEEILIFLCNEMEVLQESVLRPILLIVNINDLPSVCTGCVVQMYADDIVLYVHAKHKEQIAVELSETVTNVNKCLNDSHMSLDVQKTAYLSQNLT